MYFGRLDAGDDIVPMLAPDFTFSLLWATGGEAREFAGSFDEFAGYMAQREPDGQLHHINLSLPLSLSNQPKCCAARFARIETP